MADCGSLTVNSGIVGTGCIPKVNVHVMLDFLPHRSRDKGVLGYQQARNTTSMQTGSIARKVLNLHYTTNKSDCNL